jgi:hypothetical protein
VKGSSTGTLHGQAGAGNTSIVYGDRLIFKFFRRLTEGQSDVESADF